MINTILSAITAFAIVFAAIQIIINRKQLYLSTISKCIDDYRNLGELQQDTSDAKVINRYIDLTNEELFYFQHNYMPKVVSKEWIEGMIDFMPLTDKEGNIVNENYAIKYISENRNKILQNYPRVRSAFEINGKYNIDAVYSSDENKRAERVRERKKLVNEILKNVKRFDWFD